MSDIHKLIERDAYTFQYLSADAIETFYPEAQKMFNQDRNNFCISPQYSSHKAILFNANKIQQSYKLDNTAPDYEKALRMAACNNQIEDLQSIISEFKGLINNQDKNPEKQRTALHWAIEKKNTDCRKGLT